MYLDQVREMLDRVCDSNNEIYFLGDFNIDWNSKECPLRHKLLSLADAFGLQQVITKPTRICCRADLQHLLDLIFTNAAELRSKTISVPVGCSDHNLVAITRFKKSGQKIIFKRIFRNFNEGNYYDNLRNIDWSIVLSKEDPDLALNVFNDLLGPIIDKYAPVKKKKKEM